MRQARLPGPTAAGPLCHATVGLPGRATAAGSYLLPQGGYQEDQ
jgi:hypothetical protein